MLETRAQYLSNECVSMILQSENLTHLFQIYLRKSHAPNN